MPTTPPMPARKSASPTNKPPNRRRIEPERLKQPDFLQPLLDAKLEEQPRQQQRRDDKEGAEIGEVLAEVGRAARRGEPLRAHVVDRKSHRQRVELAEQRFLVLLAGRSQRRPLRRNQPQRGQPAMPRAPQLLAALDRNERLRRRAIAVPVLLVDRPHALEVDRKRRIPIRNPIRVGDARILGNQIAIGRRPHHRHNARHAGTPPSACATARRLPTRSSRPRPHLRRPPGDRSRPTH